MSMDRMIAATAELKEEALLSPLGSYLVLALGIVLIIGSLMALKVPRAPVGRRTKFLASAFLVLGLVVSLGGIMAGTTGSIFAR